MIWLSSFLGSRPLNPWEKPYYFPMNFNFCLSKPELTFIKYNQKYIFTNTISLVINTRVFLKFPGLDFLICKWGKHLFSQEFNTKIKKDQVFTTPQHIANMQWTSFKLHLSFRTSISFWASTQSPFVSVEDMWACEKKQVLTVKKEVVDWVWNLVKRNFLIKILKT